MTVHRDSPSWLSIRANGKTAATLEVDHGTQALLPMTKTIRRILVDNPLQKNRYPVTTDTRLTQLYALAWPAASMLILLALVERTPMDHWISDWLFDSHSRTFNLNDSFLFKRVLHDWARNIAYISALLILAGLAWSWLANKPRWRPPLTFMFISMLLSTAAIAIIKYSSDIYCPNLLLEYGGQFQRVELFDFQPSNQPPGQCWPSGHASTGFCFLGFFYAARVYAPRWALPCLIAAIGLGALFSVSQTIRGVHFFSHGIWTGLIIWAINIVLAAGWLPATTCAPQQPITEIQD